jgi:hypothetical protein
MQDLQFSQIDIYYKYAFDLGHPVNPIDAARRLLRTDFAQAFRNHATGEDEIADRYRHQTISYRKFLDAQQALQEMQTRSGPSPYFKLLLIDPIVYGPALFRGLRRVLLNEAPEPDMVEPVEKDEGYDEVTDAVAEFVSDLVALLAIQENVDRTVFHEDYLDKIPFVRVGLQPFEATLAGESVVFDVAVTIHRSGIAILTAYGIFSHTLGVREIIELERMSLLPIHSCEIPSTVIKRYHTLLYGGSHAFGEKFASEDRPGYVRLRVEEGTVLAALFDAYRYSIIEAAQYKRYRSLDSLHLSLRSQQYLGYPIIFVRHPEVDTGEDFKAQYADTLAKLVLGFDSPSKLRQREVEEICRGDLSNTDDYSLYLTEGSATVLYYGNAERKIPAEIRSAEWVRETFMTTVVIDILVLQRMILATYAAQLDQVTLDVSGLNRLNRIKQDLLVMLEEYEVLGLSHYGSVYDIIQRGQEILRIRDMHTLFVQRLENIERLVQVVESRRRIARDQLLKRVTTIVSFVLSFPAAHNIVDIVRSWASVPSRAYPSWIQLPFVWIVERANTRPVYTTLVLYLAIFVLTSFAIWSGTLLDWLRRRQRVVPTPRATKSTARTLSPMSFTVESIDTTASQKENATKEN